LPGDVLSIEGLGSAPCGTRPARIVRWVALPASKRTPPARAAQQLVPARPLVFGFALLCRACIGTEQAVTSRSATWALPNIGFLSLTRRPSAGKQAICSLLNAGSAHRTQPATKHFGRALAAKGRTARADAARNCLELARPCGKFLARPGHVFERRLAR
jgi:hypothetical protein